MILTAPYRSLIAQVGGAACAVLLGRGRCLAVVTGSWLSGRRLLAWEHCKQKLVSNGLLQASLQAHNGSGKTTCFTLGMLGRVDTQLQAPQVGLVVHESVMALLSVVRVCVDTQLQAPQVRLIVFATFDAAVPACKAAGRTRRACASRPRTSDPLAALAAFPNRSVCRRCACAPRASWWCRTRWCWSAWASSQVRTRLASSLE